MSLSLPRFRSMTLSSNLPVGGYGKGEYLCHGRPLPVGSGGRDLRWFPVLNATDVIRFLTRSGLNRNSLV